MRLLVKIGGAQLEDPDARAQLARSVKLAHDDGHQVVIVHGGGNQIRAWSSRLGIADRYHDGLRITDADTAEVAAAVLCGLVNKELVGTLQQHAMRAVGLCGADGATFSARKHTPQGHDLGFVGQVDSVDTALVDLLLDEGFVPVVATIAPLAARARGDSSRLYNINADMAAGGLAKALGADAVLFLTDVPGVKDADGVIRRRLTVADCDALHRSGAIGGGMKPKLSAALHALSATPEALVKIAPAASEDAVMGAIDPEIGTVLCGSTDHG